MDWPTPTLFVVAAVLFIALLVVLIVVSVRRERERHRRIRYWVARHGWTIVTRPVVDWEARLPGQNRRGVSLLVHGMMHGRVVAVAEYSYTTESMSDSQGNRSTTTHYLIVTAVRLDVPYPPIAVESRGALSRLGRAMFGDNATAIGDDEFDRRFRVRTRSPAMAQNLLGPALVAEHLAGRVPPWSLASQDLLSWQAGQIGDPRQIATLAARLLRVAQLFGR